MKRFVKTNVVQLIGLILTVEGFIILSGVKWTQTSGSPNIVFSNIYIRLVFVGIAVYAGIQLIRLQEVGRKLAVLWFSWTLLVAILDVLYNYFSDPLFSFLNPLNSNYPILRASFFLFGLVALNRLHDEEVIVLLGKDDEHVQRIAKVLAISFPGLGRALAGHMPLGIVLGLCYMYILRIVLSHHDTISILFFGVMTWSLFASMDRAAVKKAFQVEQPEISVQEGGLQ